VGARTGIPAASHLAPEPAHEHVPEEERGRADFPGLLQRKVRFIVPASVFIILYCAALPVLMGYARPFMETRVGPVNVAYLFALSQFFMAWIVAALYVRAANVFDRDARAILDDTHRHQEVAGPHSPHSFSSCNDHA